MRVPARRCRAVLRRGAREAGIMSAGDVNVLSYRVESDGWPGPG